MVNPPLQEPKSGVNKGGFTNDTFPPWPQQEIAFGIPALPRRAALSKRGDHLRGDTNDVECSLLSFQKGNFRI